jgi:two-component system sensor histidine kinase MprB
MSFRRRMVMLAAGAVAAAIVIASTIVYVVTRDELRGEIDSSLRQKLTPGQPQSVQIHATKINPSERRKLEKAAGVLAQASKTLGSPPNTIYQSASGQTAAPAPRFLLRARAYNGSPPALGPPPEPGLRRSGSGSQVLAGALGVLGTITHNADGSETAVSVVVPAGLGGQSGYAQLVLPDGQVIPSGGPRAALPVTAKTKAVAAGRHTPYFSEAKIGATQVRVLTERAGGDGAWQIALPLAQVDNTLEHLLLVLGAVSLGGVLLAAALGLLVSRAALVPVRKLTGATERIAKTQDLTHRIPPGRSDELGRLADSFNTMLAALERSRQSQRQLVSDASHELRTPLTSVQANLDSLALGEQLTETERARILDATRAQLRELTVLVGDLIDLSKIDVDELEVEDVRLDIAVADAIERARLHAPDARLESELKPTLVCCSPRRLDRAISNLLDNAIKWNPSSSSAGPVQVLVRDGRVEVRDHGPGISPEDLPRVFDRFYRAPAARGRPGSGIGLAIVRQVAETHGGAVRAINDEGGGARLILELPATQMTDTELGVAQAAAQV